MTTYSCPHQTDSVWPCPDCSPKAFARLSAKEQAQLREARQPSADAAPTAPAPDKKRTRGDK